MSASVIPLDRCHGCNQRATLGVFCRACLLHAADVVNSLTPAMAASTPPEPRQAPRLAGVLAPCLPLGASVDVAISAVGSTASPLRSAVRRGAPTAFRNEQHPPTLSLASRVDGCL